MFDLEESTENTNCYITSNLSNIFSSPLYRQFETENVVINNRINPKQLLG